MLVSIVIENYLTIIDVLDSVLKIYKAPIEIITRFSLFLNNAVCFNDDAD